MTDADEVVCIHDILGQIRQIYRSGFESRITFSWNFDVGRGLDSLSALVIIIVIIISCTEFALIKLHKAFYASVYASCTGGRHCFYPSECISLRTMLHLHLCCQLLRITVWNIVPRVTLLNYHVIIYDLIRKSFVIRCLYEFK